MSFQRLLCGNLPDRLTKVDFRWNLVAAIIVTVSGRLADIFGRRWFLITGAIISTIGAIVGATGHNINQMIASGVLFGLGGGMQEMVFSCIQEMVPNSRRFITLGQCIQFSLSGSRASGLAQLHAS